MTIALFSPYKTMIVKKGNKQALYQSLVESKKKARELKDGEFTSKMFANDAGTSERAAQVTLKKMFEAGEVKRKWGVLDDTTTLIYWFE